MSGKVMVALLPALFHYGETLVTTAVRMRPFVSCQAILFFCDKAKLFLDNKVLGRLDTGEASRFVTSFFEVAGYNCGQMRALWCRLYILEQKLVPQGGP